MLPAMDNNEKPASLSPSEPRREEAIFDAVLALSPAQRPAYLNQACGQDAQLRQRIELLLQSHDHARRIP
jgi:hypothetical protein